MVDVQVFKEISNKCHLGEVVGYPISISGGLLHKLYAVETSTGKYAIKKLNPQIMMRTDAMSNYIFSERIANLASKTVPAIPAKSINGEFIYKIGNCFYMVFEWTEGETMSGTTISSTHSEKIGSLLARIHKTDFSELHIKEKNDENEYFIEWKNYLYKGKENNAEWFELLLEMVDRLYEWTALANKANRSLSTHLVISHRDLDPKNVLWHNSQPILIDWESAGYINPLHDLIETALYWSEDDNRSIDKEKFLSFINSYKQSCGEVQANWSIVLQNGFIGKLSWLEYNIKRSLLIECSDKEEQLMGTVQVMETIKDISEYADKISTIVHWLNDIE